MITRASWIRLFPVLLFACFLLIPLFVRAQQSFCPGIELGVTGGTKVEQGWVCDAARNARPFFKLNGLKLRKGLVLIISGKLAGKDGSDALGQYDGRRNQIRILSYEQAVRQFRKSPPPLGLRMGPELWRSYVVHELAHAGAETAFAPGVEKFTASEYIAAVAQLTSLSRETREKVIRHFPKLPGFENRNEITAIYYFFDPGKFALKAYLHYSRPENGSRFIRRLLRKGLPDSTVRW
jgi:hypothetical protein